LVCISSVVVKPVVLSPTSYKFYIAKRCTSNPKRPEEKCQKPCPTTAEEKAL
jgi:hypothetical protein